VVVPIALAYRQVECAIERSRSECRHRDGTWEYVWWYLMLQPTESPSVPLRGHTLDVDIQAAHWYRCGGT
jgi:hypothetical protein